MAWQGIRGHDAIAATFARAQAAGRIAGSYLFIGPAGVGKASFSADALVDNVKAFVGAINRGKPTGVKGTYIKKISLSSTMGPGVRVEIGTLASA